MAQILEGIRIVDWSAHVQGPVATAMLGDLGAEIIKIEEPGRGDPLRGQQVVQGGRLTLQTGENYMFEANNRNKKGVTVNLKKQQGREIIYRLVEKSDVFIQNFRKGVAEALGLSYETLCRFNPRIVYATGSGYGLEGPESGKPVNDQTVLARSGMMEIIAAPQMPPQYLVGAIADNMGAVVLSWGILAALVARERLGIGQRVDVSLLGSFMLLQRANLEAYLNLGKEIPRWSQKRAANPLNNYYECADKRWLFMGLSDSDRFWPDFCKALGLEQLQTDPRFENALRRRENKTDLISILCQVFSTKPSSEWVDIFSGCSDFPFNLVTRVSEFAQDPQVWANQYIQEVKHPHSGLTLKHVGVPVTFSDTPVAFQGVAPGLGQHTEEILSNICGYSREEIGRLREEKVI